MTDYMCHIWKVASIWKKDIYIPTMFYLMVRMVIYALKLNEI